jgi:hypothetical protein
MITVSVDESSPSSPLATAGAPALEPVASGKEPAVDPPERGQRPKRLDDLHKLCTHLCAYVVSSALLIGIWLATGTGYFWPSWVLVGWGALVALRGSDYYWRWHDHGKLISTPR